MSGSPPATAGRPRPRHRRNQQPRPRIHHNPLQPRRLGQPPAPPNPRTPDTPPPLIPPLRSRPPLRFLNHPLIQHRLEDPIQIPRLEINLRLRAPSDVLNDGVAMEIPLRE